VSEFEVLAETLRLERVRRRIKQGVLAAELGVSQNALCGWESRRHAPSRSNAVAWAAALGVEVPAAVLATLWAPPVCGELGGYQRHLRLGEVACDPCKAANAANMRFYRAGVSGV
jgi:transcriptional regulator with XRE-family HTH domain